MASNAQPAQLSFAVMVPPPAAPAAPREFVLGVAVDHSDIAGYLHLIRGQGDPERSPRPVGGRLDRAPHRTLADVSVEKCSEEIIGLLTDGRARTFNAIGVELLDHTADTLLGSPYDQALWHLVGREAVEHTLDVPILFRIPGPRDE
jgi:hypothetical protein